MKLDVRAAALTAAIVWGVILMFGAGILHVVFPEYGREFYQAMASVYPGYDGSATVPQLFIGGAYGFVDGLIGGGLFAWIYNRLARSTV